MQLSTIIGAKGGNVVTIQPDASVADLVAMLAEHNVGALVVSPTADESLRRIRSLCLRSSPLQGALVGVVNPDSGPHCDDFYEHEPWDRLGRRRGSALVTVLARRVRSAATADDLEGLASAALAREVTK